MELLLGATDLLPAMQQRRQVSAVVLVGVALDVRVGSER